MKRETFEEQLRSRLDGYETQVPEHLWEEIDARLSQQSGRRKRTRYVWMTAVSVAAAVLALFVLYVSLPGDEDAISKVSTPQTAPSHTHAGDNTDMTADPPSADPPSVSRPSLSQSAFSRPSLSQSAFNHPSAESPTINHPAVIAETTGDTDGIHSSQVIPSDNTPHQNDNPSDNTPHQNDNPLPSFSKGGAGVVCQKMSHPSSDRPHSPLPEVPSHPARQSWRSPYNRIRVSLYADNLFGRGGDVSPVYMSPALADAYTSAYENAPKGYHAAPPVYYLTNYQEKSEHHRPVTVGLSVRYALDDRWGVQTGLTYSWLSSDFIHTMNGTSIVDKQALQYVGIPLNVSYEVWRTGAFSLYASAGASVLINSSAKVKTDGIGHNLHHDRLQWSMGASVGAQYNLLPSLGVYAEPGVTYYPDNGSSVQNFFKDKPVNPSLQFGLRWDF